MFVPVVLARKHRFGKASNLILDHMISQLSPELRESQYICSAPEFYIMKFLSCSI